MIEKKLETQQAYANLIVAGDDDDTDAGLAALGDGGRNGGTRRVEHGGQTNEGHVALVLLEVLGVLEVAVHLGALDVAEAEHTEAVAGVRSELLLDSGAHVGRELHHLALRRADGC